MVRGAPSRRRGRQSGQGATSEEALANLKEALKLYVEDEVLPEGLEPPINATLRRYA